MHLPRATTRGEWESRSRLLEGKGIGRGLCARGMAYAAPHQRMQMWHVHSLRALSTFWSEETGEPRQCPGVHSRPGTPRGAPDEPGHCGLSAPRYTQRKAPPTSLLPPLPLPRGARIRRS